MTKPRFGIWTSVEDQPVPEEDQVFALTTSHGGFLLGEYLPDEGFRYGEYDWECIGNITHWMPEPPEGPKEDAFTELRALIEQQENTLRSRHPDYTAYALDVIREIREVIGE